MWVAGKRVATLSKDTGQMVYDEAALQSLDVDVKVADLEASAAKFRK